jgi:hypothetical protein
LPALPRPEGATLSDSSENAVGEEIQFDLYR